MFLIRIGHDADEQQKSRLVEMRRSRRWRPAASGARGPRPPPTSLRRAVCAQGTGNANRALRRAPLLEARRDGGRQPALRTPALCASAIYVSSSGQTGISSTESSGDGVALVLRRARATAPVSPVSYVPGHRSAPGRARPAASVGSVACESSLLAKVALLQNVLPGRIPCPHNDRLVATE